MFNYQKLMYAESQFSFPQTRGGYGHGGGGGHGHGAITLDPVSIISLLALGNSSHVKIKCLPDNK